MVCVGCLLWTRKECSQPEDLCHPSNGRPGKGSGKQAGAGRRTRTLTGHSASSGKTKQGGHAGSRLSSALQAKPPPRGKPLETHQNSWLQRVHTGTQGPQTPVSWGSGMGTTEVKAGQATGPTVTRLQDCLPFWKGLFPGCGNSAPWGVSQQRSLLSFTEEKSPGVRAEEAEGRGLETAAQPGANLLWWRGQGRQGTAALAGHTCGDRWSLQDNPSADTGGSLLWAPLPPLPAMESGGGVCSNCSTKPSSPRNLATMWAMGGSCLSPGILASLLLSLCLPPEATLALGEPPGPLLEWATTTHTDGPAVHSTTQLQASGSQSPGSTTSHCGPQEIPPLCLGCICQVRAITACTASIRYKDPMT